MHNNTREQLGVTNTKDGNEKHRRQGGVNVERTDDNRQPKKQYKICQGIGIVGGP
jgi:hypothetical protein